MGLYWGNPLGGGGGLFEVWNRGFISSNFLRPPNTPTRDFLGFSKHRVLISTEPHGLVSSELCIFVLNIFKQMPLSIIHLQWAIPFFTHTGVWKGNSLGIIPVRESLPVESYLENCFPMGHVEILGRLGLFLLGFGMSCFIQTTLFWTNCLSYVHLCKQLYHSRIM